MAAEENRQGFAFARQTTRAQDGDESYRDGKLFDAGFSRSVFFDHREDSSSMKASLANALGLGVFQTWLFLNTFARKLTAISAYPDNVAMACHLASFAGYLIVFALLTIRKKCGSASNVRATVGCATVMAFAEILPATTLFLHMPPNAIIACLSAISLAGGMCAGYVYSCLVRCFVLNEGNTTLQVGGGLLISCALLLLLFALPSSARIAVTALAPYAAACSAIWATRLANVERKGFAIDLFSSQPPFGSADGERPEAPSTATSAASAPAAPEAPAAAPGSCTEPKRESNETGEPEKSPSLQWRLYLGSIAMGLVYGLCSGFALPYVSEGSHFLIASMFACLSMGILLIAYAQKTHKNFGFSPLTLIVLPMASFAQSMVAVLQTEYLAASLFIMQAAYLLLASMMLLQLPRIWMRTGTVHTYFVARLALEASVMAGMLVRLALSLLEFRVFSLVSLVALGLLLVSLTITFMGEDHHRDAWSLMPPREIRREGRFRRACHLIEDEYELTPRESEIMELIVRGRNGGYVQEKLVISKSTFQTHMRNMYNKLDVHSNQELIDLLESSIEKV